MKDNNVTGKELFYILDLFEHMEVTHWLDGGWGVDVLAGKQRREHRDTDIDFNTRHTQKVIQELEDIGYKIEVDWMSSRMGLKHGEHGYLNIHPTNLNDDRSVTQVNSEGGNYIFQNDWFSETSYKNQEILCILKKTRLLSHSDYDLIETDHFNTKNLKSIT